jgi:hypothetical protein
VRCLVGGFFEAYETRSTGGRKLSLRNDLREPARIALQNFVNADGLHEMDASASPGGVGAAKNQSPTQAKSVGCIPNGATAFPVWYLEFAPTCTMASD